MAWGPGCGRCVLRGKHSEQPGRVAALQRRAAAAAEAAVIAAQKTRACRALLEVQEAAASALEAALKKCEEEISEIQAEVQQESIFELERSACREDSGAAGAAAPGLARPPHGVERYMQQDVVEGLESELRRVREISAQLGIGASTDASGLAVFARRADRLCGQGGRAAGGRQPGPVRHSCWQVYAE